MLKKLDTFLQESCSSVTGKTVSVEKSIEPNKSKARLKIEKAINESTDLISALECVGAMYGIPASNIISDNSINGIRVQDDTIIAPQIPNPAAQSKPIMQAIGTVLDYISQRIDDKLKDYQMNNIQSGHDANVIANANPNKGKCVGLYKDDEGGEILAYDTGLVDSPHTPAAMAKIKELRDTNQIPAFDPSANRPSGISGLSYFTDEDDITNDVDMSGSPDSEPVPDEADSMPVNDVSDQIQESAYHVNLISKFGDTTHLGYDLLQKQGFEFIKPIDSVVLESGDAPTNKNLKLEDFKHMKFDNTEILKAVECFNKARASQSTTKNGKMNLREFVRNKDFNEGITHLEKQFDCHIAIKFVKSGSINGDNCATDIINDIKHKVTVSKSKGFQLGGMPINIVHLNRYFESETPDDDVSIFGQRIASVLCHEIFHNIAAALRYESVHNTLSFAVTMNIAAATKNAKAKRSIITNYVESLDKMYKSKIMDSLVKKRLVKKLTILSSVYDDQDIKNAKKYLYKDNSEETADEYIDKMIKKMSKMQSKISFGKARYQINHLLSFAIDILILSLKPHILWIEIPIAAFMLIDMAGYIADGVDYFSKKSKVESKGKRLNSYEEYYCDLFASMYQLPITFLMGKDKWVINDFDSSKVNKLAKLEKDVFETLRIDYPTDLERIHAGVTAAKSILESDKIDPSTKKYCQWIVDNFSDIHNTDIDVNYNSRVFDPKEAEDLDKHLERIIKDNGIPITESFIRWVCSDKLYKE